MRASSILWGVALLPGMALAQSLNWDLPSGHEFDVRRTWINAGFYSAHFKRNAGLENVNPGLGFEYPLNDTYRLTAGTFHNSDRRQSHYLGLYVLPLEYRGVRFGAVVGGFDGYPQARNGGWFPALIPVMAIEGQNWGLNIAFVPEVRDRVHGAISFQLKYRFSKD